jgi:fatty-acyl-CoA synthase
MFLPLTPLRFLERAKNVFGPKVGIVSGDLEFTYRQFADRCERLAGALKWLGIQAGERVAYLSFNNHQLLEGYYGVVQAGAIVMPLNVRLTTLELQRILEHATPRALLYEGEFSGVVEELQARCPFVAHWIELGAEYEALLAAAKAEPADYLACDESSIAELFYTSGSTGPPKGVMLSHRTLYLHALDIVYQFRRPEKMVDLHTIPLFHANGWGRPQASVMLGVKQVMVRRFEPGFVFRMTEKHKATDLCLVPTMLNALINSPEREKFDLSSLRRITIGGAANSPELVARAEEAFPGCECGSGYGLTETSPVATNAFTISFQGYTKEERQRVQATAGWPSPGVVIRVVDEEMNDVPRDRKAIGEVVIQSDHVMDGYFREPDSTRAVMTGTWLHTGDMAVWDDTCCIQIVDRKKEIIISGGENISSIEVEKAIFAHPAVLECAVVPAPDSKWGEVPAAVVVVKPGMALTEAELCNFLESRLAHFKRPKLVEFSLDPLPKSGTGKIRKADLKGRFWAGKERRVQG